MPDRQINLRYGINNTGKLRTAIQIQRLQVVSLASKEELSYSLPTSLPYPLIWPTHKCAGSCSHTHTHTHTHLQRHTHTPTHTHTETHFYTYTHTHTHIYIYNYYLPLGRPPAFICWSLNC